MINIVKNVAFVLLVRYDKIVIYRRFSIRSPVGLRLGFQMCRLDKRQVFFCIFSTSFFCLWWKKCKNTEKFDFDQQTACKAIVSWLKYTTSISLLYMENLPARKQSLEHRIWTHFRVHTFLGSHLFITN